MEDVKVKEFLSLDHGSGSGYGDGSGSGSGYGYGDGYGSGSGYGYGDGSGYGYGSGSGSGSGYGLAKLNDDKVYLVDDVPTIFCAIHGNVAKGFILQSDLSKIPCYIVKGNNIFAHGDTLHDAMHALTDKMFDDLPEEERIAEFVKCHELGKEYPNTDLYDWHHRLTGSCEAGRNAFAKDHGIDMDGSMTVEDFVKLTQNSYGGNTIKKILPAYK